ncbi:MAG: hypothetical protein KKD00_03960, partial [Gammaproteobacteria bacterium]|nr:hypothetical protein [Gammaproteobacteria bacterium]
LLGAPVALGYLGYELALADSSNALVSQETKVTADEFISSEHSNALSAHLTTFADSAVSPARAEENFHYAQTLAASILNLPAQLVTGLRLKSHTLIRVVFAHGRLIDPAIYANRVHH